MVTGVDGAAARFFGRALREPRAGGVGMRPSQAAGGALEAAGGVGFRGEGLTGRTGVAAAMKGAKPLATVLGVAIAAVRGDVDPVALEPCFSQNLTMTFSGDSSAAADRVGAAGGPASVPTAPARPCGGVPEDCPDAAVTEEARWDAPPPTPREPLAVDIAARRSCRTGVKSPGRGGPDAGSPGSSGAALSGKVG